MFETRLTVARKLIFITLCLFNFVVIGLVATLLFTESMPARAAVPLTIGIGFAIAWTFFFIRLLRRGAIRRRIDPPIAAGMGFFFALAMCVVLAATGVSTDLVLLISILFLVPAGLNVIRVQIEQSELRTEERIVELQYRLAVLSERLGGDESGSMAKL